MRISILCILVWAVACGTSPAAENNCLVDGGANDGSVANARAGAGGKASGSGGRSSAGNGGSGGGGSGGRSSAGSGGQRGGSGAGGSVGASGAGGGGQVSPPTGDCSDATLLWFEDFESGNYERWSSDNYNNDYGDDCQSTALSTETANSPTHSERSEITCTYSGPDGNLHRGYGGVQFDGDNVINYNNMGTGIDAPHGVVNTHWVNLDTNTVFENGKWMSLWTVSGSCDYSDEVFTLGLEDASGRIATAHHSDRQFEPGAPALPRHKWVRLTEYVNYYDGDFYVWQDGELIEHSTFNRQLNTMCQFHWGLYASGNNDDVVLFEDDNSLWKLNVAWTDFAVEPYFSVEECGN